MTVFYNGNGRHHHWFLLCSNTRSDGVINICLRVCVCLMCCQGEHVISPSLWITNRIFVYFHDCLLSSVTVTTEYHSFNRSYEEYAFISKVVGVKAESHFSLEVLYYLPWGFIFGSVWVLTHKLSLLIVPHVLYVSCLSGSVVHSRYTHSNHVDILFMLR